LAIFMDQSRKGHIHEPELRDFTSNALRVFVENLEGLRKGQILDVGPVCNENINFIAQRVRRLYICDMFIRLDREEREWLSPRMVWRHLDYSAKSFHGILLWDLIDHLDDREVGRLTELCYRMLRKNGMVVVIAMSEQEIQPVVNSFVIGDNYRVSLRPQFHLDLPLYIRQNRGVLKLLSPFSTVKSFIYRNGIREFLFQRK
jgi:hypothetical protein